MSVALLVSPPAPAAAASGYDFYYGGQTLPSGVNGIDGYIQGVSTNLNDSSSDHVAEWLTLVYTSAQHGPTWVQIGQYQGALGTISSPSSVHSYTESNPCSFLNGTPGLYYSSVDFGAPSPSNIAYYIVWDGNTQAMQCEWGTLTADEYSFRYGTLNNIVQYGYTQSSWGDAEAYLEDEVPAGNPTDPIGTTYFGLNNSHQVQSGYGMSYYIRSSNT